MRGLVLFHSVMATEFLCQTVVFRDVGCVPYENLMVQQHVPGQLPADNYEALLFPFSGSSPLQV